MGTVSTSGEPRNDNAQDDAADLPREAQRPGLHSVLEAVRAMAQSVTDCLDALRSARLGADAHPTRRLHTKIEDQKLIDRIRDCALVSASVCRRLFSGATPPSILLVEKARDTLASFAWVATEALRRLSYARDFKLPPRERYRGWLLGAVEHGVDNVKRHLDAEVQLALEVDELPHQLPASKAEMWRRLLDASERYQRIQDSAINEAAPWLLFVEFAVWFRERLFVAGQSSFNDILSTFTDRVDAMPRTEHLSISRAVISAFGENPDNYSKTDRKRANEALRAKRAEEKKRVKKQGK